MNTGFPVLGDPSWSAVVAVASRTGSAIFMEEVSFRDSMAPSAWHILQFALFTIAGLGEEPVQHVTVDLHPIFSSW
jgi:hypothetical protein